MSFQRRNGIPKDNAISGSGTRNVIVNAAGKLSANTIDGNYIIQGGNTLSGAMIIETINNDQISFLTNNNVASAISTNGYFVGSGIYYGAGQDNSKVNTNIRNGCKMEKRAV